MTRRLAHRSLRRRVRRQRDRGPGVGHEVDPQDLHGGHRQVAEYGRHQDDEHLGEVARQHVVHELLDVPEYPAAFLDGGDDGREVIVEQHHVRRVARDVRAFDAHRDAHVRVVQGRGVVHAVARHQHDVVVLLEGAQDQHLVAWLCPRKDAGLVDDALELCLVQPIEFLRFDGLPVQPDLTPYRRRREAVVARDHHHADAGPVRRLDGVCGLRPRRVAHSPQRGERQPFLSHRGVGRLLLVRERQHPQRLSRQPDVLLQQRVALFVAQRGHPVRRPDARAEREHRLQRTLRQQQTVGCHGVLDSHRHHPPFGRERDLALPLVLVQGRSRVHREFEEGCLRRVAHVAVLGVPVRVVAQTCDQQRYGKRFCMRVECDVLCVELPRERRHPPHRHATFRDGARLIGADDLRRADDLHDRQRAHQRLSLQHPPRAERERERENDRQPLRHRRYRNGDGGDERLEQAQVAGHQLQHRDDADEHRDGPADSRCETADLALEDGRLALRRLHLRRDAADLRLHAGAGYQHAPPPTHHNRAAVRHAEPLGQRRVGGHRLCVLADGQALAGERRFVDAQVDAADDPSVGGDARTFFQQHDVSGNEHLGVHLLRDAVTEYRRGRSGEAVQCLDAPARAVVL